MGVVVVVVPVVAAVAANAALRQMRLLQHAVYQWKLQQRLQHALQQKLWQIFDFNLLKESKGRKE